MATDFTKILNAGTQAGYDALATKNPNLLYFCTDTGKLYRGSVDFTDSMIAAASKPANPVAGKIYILADTNTVEAYIGGAWKVLSYPMTTTVDINSDDMHVASAKAVYDAIQAAVEGVVGAESTVKAVAAGTEAAQVAVTKGDGSVANFTVPGVVTKPTWDASARVLTIPVTGDTAVEVNIGKDVFLDPTAENKYNPTTKKIELYLNDGNGGEATKIEIPASDLVDVYTGTTSNGTSVTVGSDNKIKVDLVLDPDTKNALVLGANGLMLDLSAYAKTADVQGLVDGLQDQIDTNKEAHEANTAAINLLNGNDTEAGSVAKAVADAKSAIETDYKAADSALDAKITAMDEAYKAADTKVREDFAAADDVVRGEFAAADDVVRGEFAAADKALDDKITAMDEAYKAADTALDTAYKAADTQIRTDFAAADQAISEEVAALAAATTEWGTF